MLDFLTSLLMAGSTAYKASKESKASSTTVSQSTATNVSPTIMVNADSGYSALAVATAQGAIVQAQTLLALGEAEARGSELTRGLIGDSIQKFLVVGACVFAAYIIIKRRKV